MRILVINPPLTASLNLRKIDKRGLILHECSDPETVMHILNRFHVDMVVVFLKLLDPKVFRTMRTIFRKYPGLKVIGLASQEVSEFINDVEELACRTIESTPALHAL